MKKKITLSIEEELLEVFKAITLAEHRNVSQQVELLMAQYVKEKQSAKPD